MSVDATPTTSTTPGSQGFDLTMTADVDDDCTTLEIHDRMWDGSGHAYAFGIQQAAPETSCVQAAETATATKTFGPFLPGQVASFEFDGGWHSVTLPA